MANKFQQLHVASLEKAILELLSAHQNVVNGWYADWEDQQRLRAEGLRARRFEGLDQSKAAS